MAVDQPRAGAGSVSEELCYQAELTREGAERALVIDGLLHGSSLPGIVHEDADAVLLSVALHAQPEQVGLLIRATLRPELDVVHVHSGTELTEIARLS